MKIRLSKRIISVLLSVLMIITSIPIASISAFAASYNENDAKVKAVMDAMTSFETKLQVENASYSNVGPAYQAYVACQAALDAYTYGGEANALDGKAAALTSAIAGIGTYTGVQGTATPSFAGDTTFNVTDMAGTGYSNLLYSPQAIVTGETAAASGNTFSSVVYSSDPVVLYDGVNPSIVPVMMGTWMEASKNGFEKKRYIYSAYPCKSETDNTDFANARLVGYWRGAKGATQDWTWSWNQTTSSAGYNYATGFKGNQTTDHRSQQVPNCNRSGRLFNYTYSVSDPLYLANAIQITGLTDSTKYTETINPYWYIGTGDGANSDTNFVSPAQSITIINFTLLTNALASAGNSMKAIDPANYSEGGLATYISYMDAATSFDPNSYFTSSNGTTNCTNAMKTCITNLGKAPASAKANSADYEALRNAMTSAVMNVYSGGNTGYTTESWDAFVEKYNAAKNIMAAVNDSNTYAQASAAAAAATALTEAYNGLTLNVSKADTTALVAAINNIENKNNIFTAATHNSLLAVIETAKTTVWGSVDNYGIPTEVKFDETQQNQVDAQLTAVQNAIKALRLSMDVFVETSNGKFSMNKALQLSVSDPTDYANYSDFATAVTNANIYIENAAATDFTDYDAQFAEYKAAVAAVVDAYYGLQYSFIKLPDGTVASATNTSITTLTHDHAGKGQSMDFDYVSSATVIRMNHTAKSLPVGKATVQFGTLVDGNNRVNNMLDAISINSTAASSAEFNKGDNDKPKALSADQKVTYAGCLAKDGFSLKNFEIVSRTNNDSSYVGITSANEQITDFTSPTDEYTKMLGTTDGSGNKPCYGGVFANSKSSGTYGYVTLQSDFCVDVPDSTISGGLTADTKPSSAVYTLSGSYFGALTVWNMQSGAITYQGYSWFTSETNAEQLYSSVTVIDAAPLVDLVSLCNSIITDSAKYTDASWTKFQKALSDAQADIDYTNLNAATILSRLQKRYSDLWDAYNGLELKTFNITFSYKDSTGADTSTVVPVTYGETLSQHAEEINAIGTPADYVQDIYTYSFDSWSPAISLDTPVTKDATYTAVYTQTVNFANFDAYNTAKNNLLGLLVDDTYTIADLEQLNTDISALTYFALADTSNIYADEQTAIDAETATINNLAAALSANANKVDIDASIALADGASSEDIDRYVAVTAADFTRDSFLATTTVAGESVKGIIYDTQEASDAVVRDALNAKTPMKYTITLNGTTLVTDVPYGTPVIVNKDGTYELNVADTHPDAQLDSVGWYYSYSAPSTKNVATNEKFMTKAPSLGFIVKGNTNLRTVDAKTTGTGYAVTFIADTGARKIFDVIYTDAAGNFKMPTAPKYAYYNFGSFSNGLAEGASATVSADTTIVATYTPDTSNSYVISFFNSKAAWDDAAPTTENTYNYNELVELTSADAYCWATVFYNEETFGSTYTLLAYGSSYSFYACKAYENANLRGIVALSYADYQAILESEIDSLVDGQGNKIVAVNDGLGNFTYPEAAASVSALDAAVPVYGSGLEKVSLIGTFTLPEGYKMVEVGFLFTKNAGSDLTLENAGSNGIARFKASKYTVGNQFVINVKNSGSFTSFDYCSYAIVTNDKGESVTLYSTTYSDSVANY